MGARHPEQDAGDRDHGDYDPTEVIARPAEIRHISHADAVLPPPPAQRTSVGIEYLESLKKQSASAPKMPRAMRKPVNITCWKDTPQLYRKLIARVAGLSADVVNKNDRDLTETEKAMLRSAIADMRMCFQGLMAL